MTSLYTSGSITTLHEFGGVLVTTFGHSLSFGLSQFQGQGSWLMCEVALRLSGTFGI